MFSSNPFPELPSSPNVYFPSNFLFHHERDTACFNYHLNNSDPFISGDRFHDDFNSFADPSPTIENITKITRDLNRKQQLFSEKPVLESSQDHDDLLESTAIKELVEDPNHCSSSTAYYQSKMSFLEAIMVGKGGDKCKKKSELKFDSKTRKKFTQKPKGGFQDNPSRDQSRSVARARARERVREKMRMKKLDDELKALVNDDFYYQNIKSTAGENHWVASADLAGW
ncbi:hypothetical protein L1887_36403 [Cichorium endivia]|nr:hypothetical protein L1887_36403 [Cichorium endivia]